MLAVLGELHLGGLPLLLLAVPLQVALTLGLGLLLGAVNVFFRDTAQVLGMAFTGWFYLTPIVYPAAQVPARFRPWIELNPLTSLVELYRQAFLGGAGRAGARDRRPGGWRRLCYSSPASCSSGASRPPSSTKSEHGAILAGRGLADVILKGAFRYGVDLKVLRARLIPALLLAAAALSVAPRALRAAAAAARSRRPPPAPKAATRRPPRQRAAAEPTATPAPAPRGRSRPTASG